jgi:hypothetical protein
VVFGDSHVHAIQEAIKARAEAGIAVAVEARRLLKTKSVATDSPPSRLPGLDKLKALVGQWTGGALGARTIGDTSFEAFLVEARRLGPADVLVSAVGGNQHAVFSTVQHADPFDFFFPEDRPDATEGHVPLVPFRPLYDQFATGLRLGDGATLSALRRATKARLVHLIAPPPKSDSAYIRRYHDSHFAAEGISSLGVSSPALRLKFWQLQNRALKEICADLDIETIEPPAAACDEEGFLRRHFYARDATHANAAYGELVIEQLEQLRLERGAGASPRTAVAN